MKKKSPTILFFGTEDYSLIVLKRLVEAGYPIGAVITKPDTPKGRGHKLTAPSVKTYALSHDIPVLQPNNLKDIITDIRQFDSPVGVLVAYGKIIPESIIHLFTPGIINIHPSLLPKYRGPSPVEAAILNRDNKTGVSIMQLSKAMDAGPVYIQIPYALDFTETKPELYDTLFTIGANVLVDKLPAIIAGDIIAEPQNEKDATYCSLLSKDDGIITPTTATPGEAEAKVRAYLSYPRTRVAIGDHMVIVTKAHGVMTKKTPLDIECSNGAFLSIDELIAPSGKTMSAEEFIRGYKL